MPRREPGLTPDQVAAQFPTLAGWLLTHRDAVEAGGLTPSVAVRLKGFKGRSN